MTGQALPINYGQRTCDKIVILDDYANAFRNSSAFARLKDHEVVVYHDTVKDPAQLFAAIDVYEEEPVVGGAHPLLALANALCTPHLGYAADYQFENKYNGAVDGILAFASGQPENIINPKALRS